MLRAPVHRFDLCDIVVIQHQHVQVRRDTQSSVIVLLALLRKTAAKNVKT
jgi:hypothetical protein